MHKGADFWNKANVLGISNKTSKYDSVTVVTSNYIHFTLKGW